MLLMTIIIDNNNLKVLLLFIKTTQILPNLPVIDYRMGLS